MNPLQNINGELYIDQVSSLKLANRWDTPLYIMSESKIRKQYRRLHLAFSQQYDKTRIFYSAKANTNLSVLKILEQMGSGVDTVSPGEVFLALKAGFPPRRIFHSGVSVRDDELEYLLRKEVMINVNSLSQLQRLLQKGKPHTLSVRVNPELGAGHHEHVVTGGKKTKFGNYEVAAGEAYQIAKDAGVERFGIHMHIGSGVMEPAPLLQAAQKLLDISLNIHEDTGINFEFVNFGGGIGIPYKPKDKEFDLEQFSQRLVQLFKEKTSPLGKPEIWLEPGRYMVGEAGVLLTRVTTIKETPFRRFAGVDAGFNTLIRPAMYGSYHHMLVANRLDDKPTEKYDVVGPLCESGDVLATDRLLPPLTEGDLLAILNTGAYGYSMSSHYNSRPRPAEVLVNEGRQDLIRERETLQDLLRHQKTVERLEK
ncbi:MAG: diaminopimelate decarboxylase [Thermoproteota archaeon]